MVRIKKLDNLCNSFKWTASSFNKKAPIGTLVAFVSVPESGVGMLTRTSSEAWEIGGHGGIPVIKVEGMHSAVALEAIIILEKPQKERVDVPNDRI